MNRSKIIVHCLVKNEENFVWYAINSVLPFVDKVMVWDTGSEDNTVKVVKSIMSPKIEFKEVGHVNSESFTEVRKQMLDLIDKKYDWLMILDGDEIWPRSSLKEVVAYIQQNSDAQAIFVRTNNAIGDIYHRQMESAGHYNIKGRIGHYALRFINLRSTPNLTVSLPHGQEGFFSNGTLIQNLPHVDFVDVSYLHTTHLPRSSQDKKTIKRAQKLKYELGAKIPTQELPEIIFETHPNLVPDITNKMSPWIFFLAALQTFPKVVKRTIKKPQEGY